MIANQGEQSSPSAHGPGRNPVRRAERAEAPDRLGDFTTTAGVLPIALLATGIGTLSAFVALALLRLIGLFTNLFFFGRWTSSRARTSPYGVWLSGSVVGKHFSACRPRPATSWAMSGWRRTAISQSSPRCPSIAPEHLPASRRSSLFQPRYPSRRPRRHTLQPSGR